jgi:hypothetical protein
MGFTIIFINQYRRYNPPLNGLIVAFGPSGPFLCLLANCLYCVNKVGSFCY